MNNVLITGAAGAIGTVVRQGLGGRYPLLRLSDIAPLGEAGAGEEIDHADLRDLAAVEAAMDGIDAVVHLGGIAHEADWQAIHEHNIVGTYNVFEAARRQGVSRVIFASSNHATGYHRRERHIGPDAALRPDSRYGVSKAFGESMGRLYADKYGLGVICLRIGSFQLRPVDPRMLSTWISHRDMVQLVGCCLDAADVHFEIVYGVSANVRRWWHTPAANRLGYNPLDNAELYADEILEKHAPEDEPEAARLFHGGPFCALEFSGDLSKIE